MKVGDYVRNQFGIAKVVDIEKGKSILNGIDIDILVFDNNICFLANKETGEIKEDTPLFNKLPITKEIDKSKIKSSPNIIDLIEENDFVKIEYYLLGRKERIERIFEVEYKDQDWIKFRNAHCELCIFHHQWAGVDSKLKPIIKTIVTKEQFKSMEYKVG